MSSLGKFPSKYGKFFWLLGFIKAKPELKKILSCVAGVLSMIFFPGHRFRTVYAFGMVVLEVLGTKIEDTGTYSCRATNKWGRAEISVTLECVDKSKGQKPQFTSQIKVGKIFKVLLVIQWKFGLWNMFKHLACLLKSLIEVFTHKIFYCDFVENYKK